MQMVVCFGECLELGRWRCVAARFRQQLGQVPKLMRQTRVRSIMDCARVVLSAYRFKVFAHLGDGGEPGSSIAARLEAAIARAREEEDEFLQAVPQDETMKERQAEVYFRRNPGMLEFFPHAERGLATSLCCLFFERFFFTVMIFL